MQLEIPKLQHSCFRLLQSTTQFAEKTDFVDVYYMKLTQQYDMIW